MADDNQADEVQVTPEDEQAQQNNSVAGSGSWWVRHRRAVVIGAAAVLLVLVALSFVFKDELLRLVRDKGAQENTPANQVAIDPSSDDFNQASYLEDADVADELGSEGQYEKLLSAARKYQSQNQHDEAVRVFEEALALFPEQKKVEIAGYSYSSYLETGDQQTARNYARMTADARLADIEDGAANVYHYSSVASIYRDVGLYKEALPHYEKALELATTTNTPESDTAIAALEQIIEDVKSEVNNE